MAIVTLVDGGSGRGWPPVFGGDAEAVAAATRIGGNGEEIALRGGWCVISPSWAAAALKGALSSLGMAASAIDVMAIDMAALRWRATGEPVILTNDSMVLDGRKRLAACIKADTPFPALLVHGVPLESLDTMNNLRGRRLSDHLDVLNEAHHRSLATALRHLWRMRNGGYDRKGASPSDRQLLALLDANPGIRETMAMESARGRLMRLPAFIVWHYMIRRVNPDRAAAFTRALLDDGAAAISNEPDKREREGHPARACNDLILHSRATRDGLDRDVVGCLAAFVLAFNAFVRGTPAKSLRWAPVDGNEVEQPFPMIEGWQPEMALPESVSRHRVVGGEDGAAGADCGPSVPSATGDIMADFEQHPRSTEVWQTAFPDGQIPSFTLRMIGKREAFDLLERNTANRARVSGTVARYFRDIEAGDFQSLNGVTVKIARNGRLLDGQHRVTAIEKSGKRLPFLVVEGLDEHAFDAMDRADTKTFAHVLRERNLSNAGTIAAAVRMQWLFERDRFQIYYGLSPSNPELNRVLQQNPEILDSLDYNNRLRGVLIPAVACWVEYHLKMASRELAEAFLLKLATGEELARGNPILLLRERLIKERLGGVKRPAGEEGAGWGPDTVRQAALVILTFNKWVEGKPISQQALRWRGVAAEGFPEIVVGKDASEGGTAPAAKKRGGRGKKVAVAAPPTDGVGDSGVDDATAVPADSVTG